MKKNKLITLIVLAAVIIGFLIIIPQDLLTLESLKSKRELIAQYQIDHPLLAPLLFVLIYVSSTAISLPGATILTLAGGALFGLIKGTILVSFSSVLGATIAFLLARFLFRDLARRKMGDRLAQIEQNFEESGAFYLFSLRLVPVIPFFAINILMALTPIKAATFAVVSWAGMLVATIIYVNAGTQLAKLDSLKGILSPGIILSLVLLALFPYIARFIVNKLKLSNS